MPTQVGCPGLGPVGPAERGFIWTSYILSSWIQTPVLEKHWIWTYICIMAVKGRMRVCSVGPSQLEAFLSATSDAFAARGHFMG